MGFTMKTDTQSCLALTTAAGNPCVQSEKEKKMKITVVYDFVNMIN